MRGREKFGSKRGIGVERRLDPREGEGQREVWIEERERGKEKVGSKIGIGVKRRLDPREGEG